MYVCIDLSLYIIVSLHNGRFKMVLTRSGVGNDPDKIKLKVQRTDKNSIWPYDRCARGGFYIKALEDVTIPVGGMKKIRTGLTLEIPKGYHGILYSDSPIIDGCDDYDGYINCYANGLLYSHSWEEIKLTYNNLSKKDVTIKRGWIVGCVMIYKNIDYQFDKVLEIDIYDDSRV